MTGDSYRLTINGGHVIQKGRMERCCMSAVPILMKGQTVHLRSVYDGSLVVTTFVREEGAYVTATRHGVPCDLPEWGQRFGRLLESLTKEGML